MEEVDTFDVVWQVWQKERQSNELQQIPKSFYEDTIKYAATLTGSEEQGRTTKENLLRTLNNIYEKRKQKILIYIAYNQSLPPVPDSELKIYERISSAVRSEKMQADGQYKDNALTVIQAVPRIVLPSGKEIGPLDREQTIQVANGEDREFLLTNNICKSA